jgi:hypothetical protein
MTRRSEIERLLREVREQTRSREDGLDDLLNEKSGRRELKAYIGVDFDAFPLPEELPECPDADAHPGCEHLLLRRSR